MKPILAISLFALFLSASPVHAAQVEDGDAELQEFRANEDPESVLEEGAARQRVQPTRPGTRDCFRQLSICESACLKKADGSSSEYRACTMSCPDCETD